MRVVQGHTTRSAVLGFVPKFTGHDTISSELLKVCSIETIVRLRWDHILDKGHNLLL